MEFGEFKSLLQNHVTTMLVNDNKLFSTDIENDVLWETYLDSFPAGINEIYRERREFDCSCCKQFIKSFGGVVIITNKNKKISIWDFTINDKKYKPVVNALSKLVHSKPIKDVFVTGEPGFGTDKSHEQLDDGSVHVWEHFRIDLPKKYITKTSKTIPSIIGEFRSTKDVFKRSLDELSKDSIESVLDLISQKSLYRGEEWEGALSKFLELHNTYTKLPTDKKELFCWRASIEVGGAIGKIRNHSIGTLLIDITEGMDLNEAVRRYEAIVAPTNYKRPKAIFTKKMVEQAQQKLDDLGLLDSLYRRFAITDDITVNNVLFANKDTIKQMSSNVFDDLKKEVTTQPKKFDGIEEVPVDDFIKNILPRTSTLEVMIENRHAGNFMSLIAPENKNIKPILKWNNNFSWAYSGNIADSMKERVKTAGGKVDGIIRFSIQWNDNADNNNDYDAHCIEPRGNKIFYGNKHNMSTSGELDVDIIRPMRNIAVENITWSDINKMQEGKYKFLVHNYSHRGGTSGFSAEIEYDGTIYSYEYRNDIRNNEKVLVAEIIFNKKTGIEFISSLPSTESSKNIWGVNTNQFIPVSMCMFSPNYWDGQKGIGNRHYFFMLKGCKNEGTPNGFFNEFLHEDLLEHKRVFEALGSRMKVEQTDNQLSGVGFASTKRNSIVCKVEGSISRVIKIIF